MIYETYKASRIRKRDFNELEELTLEGNSSMKIFLRNRRKYKWGGRIFLAREDNIIGWALYLGYRVRGGAQIHVYVGSGHRRKGIGGELCRMALAHSGRCGTMVRVYPHTDIGKKFYGSVGFSGSWVL